MTLNARKLNTDTKKSVTRAVPALFNAKCNEFSYLPYIEAKSCTTNG